MNAHTTTAHTHTHAHAHVHTEPIFITFLLVINSDFGFLSVSYLSYGFPFGPEGREQSRRRGHVVSSEAISKRRYREKLKRNPELYRQYLQKQSEYNKKYRDKKKSSY